jgi:energy-coupling factor transport system ATP-binding protein
VSAVAVEVRDLFRVYSEDGAGVAALQGLTLDVREGEVCVVLGPSGSGKTTLLRILAGLDRASAGRAVVFGTDVGRLRGRALAAYRSEVLGYAEQHFRRALAEELPARELVGVQLGLAGVPARARRARAEELLTRVDLRDRADALPGELSGGEQQRVAICAALAHRPRLFLADEPTGELDAENAAVVFALIGDLAREERCTAVIVSHDPQSTAVADRVVRVRDGRVSEEAARAGGGEAIVVGKGGWLRLSEELLRRAGIGARAEARLDEQRIVVSAAEDAPTGLVQAAEPPHDAAGGRALAARDDARNSLVPPPPGRPGGVVARLRGVSKRYGEGAAATHVFDGLWADFLPGCLYAVTGPSGSGKTTLLHLLAGLDVPTLGHVLVAGTEVSRLDRAGRARLRRERVALVGQDPGLVPFLTARENAELGPALRGVPADEADTRAREALAAVGLAERAEQRVALLSAGERERVAVARALAARPLLLLADEPTSRLDQANAIAVSGLFARLARETGATVVCATHDPLVIEQADETVPLAERSSTRSARPGRARARRAGRSG